MNCISMRGRTRDKNINENVSEVVTRTDKDLSPLLFINEAVLREGKKINKGRIVTLT